MLEKPIGRPSLHPLCSVQELLDEANFFALEGLQQILLAQLAEIEASLAQSIGLPPGFVSLCRGSHFRPTYLRTEA